MGVFNNKLIIKCFIKIMKIELVKQESKNECGLCILTSLHNFYYPEYKMSKIDMYELLNYDGHELSVYELEIFAKKVGIELESYKLDFNDLQEIANDTLFVTYILNEVGNHFVICYKTKYKIIIYDSLESTKEYTYQEFKNIFSGLYISVQKRTKEIVANQVVCNNKYFFCQPNMYFLITLFIIIDLFSTILSIITNAFIKIIIDKVIPLKLTNELFYFTIFFVLAYVLNFLINYVINLIKFKKYDDLFKENILVYIKIIKNKNLDYFNKSNKEIIYEHPTAISKMIMHKYFEFPGLFADIIIFAILFTIICLTSYLFIISIFINFIFIIIFGLLKIKNNNDNYQLLHINKNKIEINFNNFYDFLLNEKNKNKLKIVEENWIKELWSYQKSNKKNSEFNLTIDLFDNSITKFIFVVFISICSYLIITNFDDSLTISNLIFITSIINMITTCINDIFNYCCSIPFYKKSMKLLNDFLNLSNLDFKNGVQIDDVKTIQISNLNFGYNSKKIFNNFNACLDNGTLIMGKNGSGKTTLFKILTLNYLNKLDGEIIYNSIPLNCLNQKYLFDNIVYLPSDACVVLENLNQLFDKDLNTKDLAINIIKATNLNLLNDDFSKGEKQIINLLNIIHLKNKIILLDESFSNISNKLNELIYHDVKNHLEKSNFVLWISHNKKCFKYFKNKVSIDDKLQT